MYHLISCNYYLRHSLKNSQLGTIFSFASVFLFLAVLPLIYAPETLPEKIMKDRDLKSYIENAKKKAEKRQKEEKEKAIGRKKKKQKTRWKQ